MLCARVFPASLPPDLTETLARQTRDAENLGALLGSHSLEVQELGLEAAVSLLEPHLLSLR